MPEIDLLADGAGPDQRKTICPACHVDYDRLPRFCRNCGAEIGAPVTPLGTGVDSRRDGVLLVVFALLILATLAAFAAFPDTIIALLARPVG